MPCEPFFNHRSAATASLPFFIILCVLFHGSRLRNRLHWTGMDKRATWWMVYRHPIFSNHWLIIFLNSSVFVVLIVISAAAE